MWETEQEETCMTWRSHGESLSFVSDSIIELNHHVVGYACECKVLCSLSWQ